MTPGVSTPIPLFLACLQAIEAPAGPGWRASLCYY